jgi:branched-subunit amino acid transport protein AzlD
MTDNNEEINLRDLDEAHNEQILNRIDKEVKSKNSLIAVLFLTSTYMLISTVIWGMFFYRGGSVEVQAEGYVIDLIVIGLIVYGISSLEKKGVALQTFFGTIMFMLLDILCKDIILYPFIVKLLGV